MPITAERFSYILEGARDMYILLRELEALAAPDLDMILSANAMVEHLGSEVEKQTVIKLLGITNTIREKLLLSKNIYEDLGREAIYELRHFEKAERRNTASANYQRKKREEERGAAFPKTRRRLTSVVDPRINAPRVGMRDKIYRTQEDLNSAYEAGKITTDEFLLFTKEIEEKPSGSADPNALHPSMAEIEHVQKIEPGKDVF